MANSPASPLVSCHQGPLPKGGFYLAALHAVWKIALAGKPSGGEWLSGVGVFGALQGKYGHLE